jgi:hypothetical protein
VIEERFMPDAALLPLLGEGHCEQCCGPCLRAPTHAEARGMRAILENAEHNMLITAGHGGLASTCRAGAYRAASRGSAMWSGGGELAETAGCGLRGGGFGGDPP